MTFNGTRYVVEIPFKSNHDTLPDNYQLCERRLGRLKKRLLQNPDMVSQYEKIFTEYENDGIIERVFDTEEASPKYVHYLPHQPVIRKDKETT